MAKRKKRSVKRSSRPKTRSSKRPVKRKLAGFTKVGSKFSLVFKKGKTLSVGKKKFTKKASLNKEAQKFV